MEIALCCWTQCLLASALAEQIGEGGCTEIWVAKFVEEKKPRPVKNKDKMFVLLQ